MRRGRWAARPEAHLPKGAWTPIAAATGLKRRLPHQKRVCCLAGGRVVVVLKWVLDSALGCLLLLQPPCSSSNPLITLAPDEGIHQGCQKDHGRGLKSNLLPNESKEKQCLGLSCPKHPSAVARRNPHQGERVTLINKKER